MSMNWTSYFPTGRQLVSSVIATAVASIIFAYVVSKTTGLKKLVKDYETS